MFSGGNAPTTKVLSSSMPANRIPTLVEYNASVRVPQVGARSALDASVIAWCTAAGLAPNKAVVVARELHVILSAVGRSLSVEDAELLAASLRCSV